MPSRMSTISWIPLIEWALSMAMDCSRRGPHNRCCQGGNCRLFSDACKVGHPAKKAALWSEPSKNRERRYPATLTRKSSMVVRYAGAICRRTMKTSTALDRNAPNHESLNPRVLLRYPAV
jgi:hypothetical protein